MSIIWPARTEDSKDCFQLLLDTKTPFDPARQEQEFKGLCQDTSTHCQIFEFIDKSQPLHWFLLLNAFPVPYFMFHFWSNDLCAGQSTEKYSSALNAEAQFVWCFFSNRKGSSESFFVYSISDWWGRQKQSISLSHWFVLSGNNNRVLEIALN